MARDAATAAHVTYEGYLALESATGAKHEYVNGAAWAMAGGTPAHARIIGNLVRALGNALEGTACVEYGSELKVRVEATGLATYPDVSVICGPLERSAVDRNAAINPTVLVEVISPSTEDWDTGGKFLHYGRIPALREVVYVWPDERRVQVRSRNEDRSWTLRDTEGHADLRLSSLGVSLAHAAIFARVEHAEG